MYTTLNRIREHEPCKDGWKTLLKHLCKTKPDDEPLSLLTILDSNGFDHTLWCFRAVDGFKKEKLLLGIGFARGVEHLMPDESKKSLDVFERYANGLATQQEFEMAQDTADAVADAAFYAAFDAETDAAYAADAAYLSGLDADADVDAVSDTSISVQATARDAAVRLAIRAQQEAQLRGLLEKTCTQP